MIAIFIIILVSAFISIAPLFIRTLLRHSVLVASTKKKSIFKVWGKMILIILGIAFLLLIVFLIDLSSYI